jgi:acylphosphatase
MKAFRFVVSGRVQGVGYRAFCRSTARNLGLAGYARNLADGTVETLVSGPNEAIERYRASLLGGPGLARVDRITGTEISVDEARANRFEIG